LFTTTNVTKEANELQLFVNQQLKVILNTLKSDVTPEMEIGTQCEKYYSCDFRGHCWKMFEEVEYPVYEIKRLEAGKLFDLVGQGILCQTQVPVTYPLSDHQKIQVHGNKTQSSPEPDKEAIGEFLKSIKGPVAFLDFETFYSAIPVFDDIRPYQQVPFQYSIHLVDKSGNREHYEFLGDGKTDPRRALVESMLPVLRNAKTILCYNMSFEKTRLEELRDLFDEYRDDLQSIINKLVDLIVPFRSKYVYHYKMNGSASIKNVLPALLPHLSYEALEIGEGGAASQAYLNLFVENDDAVIDHTRKALLEYCKLDTLAMVELFQYLRNLVLGEVESKK
jgi:hypothetical protein